MRSSTRTPTPQHAVQRANPTKPGAHQAGNDSRGRSDPRTCRWPAKPTARSVTQPPRKSTSTSPIRVVGRVARCALKTRNRGIGSLRRSRRHDRVLTFLWDRSKSPGHLIRFRRRRPAETHVSAHRLWTALWTPILKTADPAPSPVAAHAQPSMSRSVDDAVQNDGSPSTFTAWRFTTLSATSSSSVRCVMR
jgi:hypothetical protein